MPFQFFLKGGGRLKNRNRTSSELASLAGKLMHHKDKEVRSLAAIALANRRK